MRQEDGQTVAAVVVTYNRKKLLDECLQALLRQTRPVDGIIIIDNASTDSTPEFLAEKGYLSNPIIDYVRLPENTGGAGGFHEGVKRGYEKGFDWLWLMDDDCEPDSNALAVMLSFVFKRSNHDISFVSPVISSPDGTIQWWHHKMIPSNAIFLFEKNPIPRGWRAEELSTPVEINANGFCGPMIKSKLIREAGLPERSYFIYCDDAEYTFRLSRRAKAFVVPSAFIYHKDGSNQHGYQSRGGEWKVYYGMRNNILASLRHGAKRPLLLCAVLYVLIRRCFGGIVRRRAGLVNVIKYMLMGCVAGFRGVRGKISIH